jgi:hypothetical protein
LTNKSVQFFYFWARTRLVQHALIILSVLWIMLIFYKSMVVVELMRHDVNVSKEAVDALLPKRGLHNFLKQNFPQYLFTSMDQSLTSTEINGDEGSQASNPNSNKFKSSAGNYHSSSKRVSFSTSTINYFKQNLHNLISIKKDSRLSSFQSLSNSETIKTNKNNNDNINKNNNYFNSDNLVNEQSWQSLDYYHWLTLFDSYNVSLYNRYLLIK